MVMVDFVFQVAHKNFFYLRKNSVTLPKEVMLFIIIDQRLMLDFMSQGKV